MTEIAFTRGAKRPRKNVLMFLLSLILGGSGVYLSKNYIEEQIAYYKGELEKTEPMAKVVVPNRKLLRGEIVKAADLSVREIPVKYADSNSVTGDTYDVAIGQRVDFDVDQGRPLLWAHLEGGLSPTFSGKVPEGLRAMTVRVDEINSISGFLQPRDRIDLLLSYGSSSTQRIYPIIQNLEIIATGVQTVVDKSGAAAQRSFSTVTVQVTPEMAQRITLAQQVGKLTAMLRNPDDESPLSDKPMTVAELLNIATPVQPKKKITPRQKKRGPTIEYIIGGS